MNGLSQAEFIASDLTHESGTLKDSVFYNQLSQP